MSRLSLGSLAFASALAGPGCAASVACDEPGALCFAAADPLHLRVGFRPDALLLIDLDADGERDLVGASGLAGTLTAVWGGPDGLTAAATTWSIGQEVTGLVVADLDADGRLDLATALPHADAVAVLRGRGGRQFTLPAHHPAGAIPRTLLAADLDGTGPPELVTANLGDGTLTVLRDFIADPPIVVGPGPRALASGDLDGDGHLDLAVALADIDAVQVMRGDGHGGLWPATLHPVGAAPYAIVAADLDRDGHLDLATADALDDTISVLWADSSGELQRRIAWPTLFQPSALVVAEPHGALPVLGVLSEATATIQQLDPRSGTTLTGGLRGGARALGSIDGHLLAAGETLSVLYESTGLKFTPVWQGPAASRAWPIDIDGDEIDELLVLEDDADSGGMTKLWWSGVAAATALQTGLDTSYPDIVTGDLTGDGRPDAIAWSDSQLVVLAQQPDGELLAEHPPTAFQHKLRDVALTDVDGDGVIELVALVSAETYQQLHIFGSDPTGALQRIDAIALDVPPGELHLVDGDGDARADLLIQQYANVVYLEDSSPPARDVLLPYIRDLRAISFGAIDGHLHGFACTSSGLYHIPDVLGLAPSEPLLWSSTPCVETFFRDLDGDGDGDLLVLDYEPDPFEYDIWFTPWIQYPGGGWAPGSDQSITSNSLNFPRLTFAQLDDGAADLIVVSDDATSALNLSIGPSLGGYDLVRFGTEARLHLADIDHDGAADLLGLGDQFSVALADGHGGFGPLLHSSLTDKPGSAESTIAAQVFADFDGDGLGELLVLLQRLPAGPYSMQLVAASLDVHGAFVGQAIATLRLFKRPDLRAVDLDGDGALDLLACDLGFQPDCLLLRGRGDGGFVEPQPLMLDLPPGVLNFAVHDMNRDGHLDLLVSWVKSYDESGIDVSHGIGNGAFAAARRWSSLHPVYHDNNPLMVGDFDRDGHPDLVMRRFDDRLHWVRGGAEAAVDDVYPLLSDVKAITAADLDRDGHLELLAVGLGQLHIGRSRVDGSFRFASQPLSVTGVREIQAADIDGDGDLDIALFGASGATIVRQQP